MQERAKNVQCLVETLALRLQEELVKSAADLGIADMPGADEFLSLVRGMPVFNPGTIHITVPKSIFTGLFGKRFEEEQLARNIRQQLGKSFEPALASYTRVLKEWTRQMTEQLGRRLKLTLNVTGHRQNSFLMHRNCQQMRYTLSRKNSNYWGMPLKKCQPYRLQVFLNCPSLA